MDKESWLPNLITEDKDMLVVELIELVLSSLNHDKEMIRAFAVALLEKNSDEVAREINDILIADQAENSYNYHHGPLCDSDEDETLDPRGL
jgi:BioD-like phosphotransacetylase family protein